MNLPIGSWPQAEPPRSGSGPRHRRRRWSPPETRPPADSGGEPQAPQQSPEDEDYVAVLVGRLQQAHRATQEASWALQRAQEAEQKVWAQEEDYLLEAVRWHCRQTGSPRLESEQGVLVLQEVPERAVVEAAELLAAWVDAQHAALDILAQALQPVSSVPPEVALLSFYHQTGLVPDGCRIEPARGVLTLEPLDSP